MPSSSLTQGKSRYDPALDGLRGVAVLLVFLFHYGGGLRAHAAPVRLLGYLTQAGWVGVELFFVLSGFLITATLLEGLSLPGQLRNFYGRRALRILPLYLAAILCCALAALLAGARWHQLLPLLVYLGFLQNVPHFTLVALQTPPPLPLFHLWSLAVEEQYYLLWPWLVLLARTRHRVLVLSLGIFALSFIFRLHVFAAQGIDETARQSFATFLPTRAGALALGGALAAFHRKTEKQRLQPALWILAGAALLAVLARGIFAHSFLLQGSVAFRWLLPAADLLAVAVLALCLEPNPLRVTCSAKLLRFFGRISYGFYVLDILLEPVFDQLARELTHSARGFTYQAIRLLIALCLTSIAAWVSFVALERPFLRLKRWFPKPVEAAQSLDV